MAVSPALQNPLIAKAIFVPKSRYPPLISTANPVFWQLTVLK
jgi:hypothetical protein